MFRFCEFQFQVMNFGLMNAPSKFQRMMDQILSGIQFASVYLDNVIVY